MNPSMLLTCHLIIIMPRMINQQSLLLCRRCLSIDLELSEHKWKLPSLFEHLWRNFCARKRKIVCCLLFSTSTLFWMWWRLQSEKIWPAFNKQQLLHTWASFLSLIGGASCNSSCIHPSLHTPWTYWPNPLGICCVLGIHFCIATTSDDAEHEGLY